jgi:NAD(P)-dependent dehydrogenase (short-subunit alcohol dehydrogenase family)
MSKVWLITGASRGLGRVFTEAVLKAGDRVVATARNPEQLVELERRYAENVRTVPLDVTNEAEKLESDRKWQDISRSTDYSSHETHP